MATLYDQKWDILVATATTTQTLNEQADIVKQVIVKPIDAAAAAYTVTAAAPAASTDVQFTGVPGVPNDGLTFDAALVAGDLIYVLYVPAGQIPVSGY